MAGEALHERIMGTEALSRGFHSAAPAKGGGKPFAEAGLRKRFGPDVPFEVAHIDTHLELDPGKPGLRSRTKVQIKPLEGGLGPVVLDLDSLEVASVTGPEGLSWTHASGKLHLSGLPAEGGTVEVLAEGLPARGLYFTGPTPAEPERQVMAWTQCQDEDGHHLFPCVDHPRIKHPWTLRVTAPEGMEVVSNGVLVSREAGEAAGSTHWVWDQPEPMPAYLVNVIVAELEVYEDAPVTLADGREVGVRYLVPKGVSEAVARRGFHKTPAMIRTLSERIGVPYPWSRYDQICVHDFIFGGMENVAATTMTDLMLLDDRGALDMDFDTLVAHELMHQWFGDLVTCQDWSQAWLNEGWATYGEHLWMVEDLGAEEADLHRFGWLERYLGEHGGRYHRPLVLWDYRNPIDLFDRHLYEKGGLVLHTLRHELGEQGFWAGVRRYLADNRFGAVHTRDLQAAMEQATGRNLDAYFQAYVTGIGHPTIEVSVAHADGLLTVKLTQKQEGEGIASTFPVRLPVRVVQADGSELSVRLPLTERVGVFTLPAAEKPARVEVDPHFTVLADITLKAPRELLEASLLQSEGVVGRIRAARALAAEGSVAARKALAKALEDQPFWGLRAEVASLLGKQGDTAARQALLGTLGSEASPKAERAVVAALGKFRHEDVNEALGRIAREGAPSLGVEGEAARQLGKLQAAGAVEACREVLGRDSWGETLRMRALEGLGASRDPSVLETLIAWTGEDRPARCRVAAAAALGQLATDVASVREAVVDVLAALTSEGDFRLRLASVGALGRTKTPRAAGVLTRLHQSDPDGRLARTAYEARAGLASSSEDGMAELRRSLDGLTEENRQLKERVAKLEANGGEASEA